MNTNFYYIQNLKSFEIILNFNVNKVLAITEKEYNLSVL